MVKSIKIFIGFACQSVFWTTLFIKSERSEGLFSWGAYTGFMTKGDLACTSDILEIQYREPLVNIGNPV